MFVWIKNWESREQGSVWLQGYCSLSMSPEPFGIVR